MAFGAKIKLSVDTSGATRFRKEIQGYVNAATVDNPIRLKNFAVAMTASQKKQIVRDLQNYLSSDSSLTLKINKIDATGAVDNLRQQLQTMLSGLSITGLKEFLGTDSVDRVTQDINAAKQATMEWASQMQVVGDIQKRLGSTFQSSLSGNQMIGDQSEIANITSAYTTWQQKVEQLKASKTALSTEELTSLQQEGISLQQKISLIQREQAEQLKAANEAKKVASENELAARKQMATDQQIISLKAQIQRYSLSNSKVYKSFGSELDKMMSNLQKDATLSSEDLKKIRTRFVEIQNSARAAGATGNTFFDTLRKGWEKFGGWSLVTRSMMAAYRTIKDMIVAVKELDAAMTELKKVTDLSDASYRSFLETATQMSQRVGATLADTVNSTADFARLGYDIADASALAEAALVYKNVGDGIDDISEASESLVSTIKAFERFGVAADNAMSIVDKFNEVGNNFAISSEGIGTALQKSASSLAAANNSLEESIALVTGMNAVLQDPDKVGTALKTVSMYLRAAKTEAEDAGEATDGMANSVSELRQELLTLTHGKVDIMVDDQTFKSTYQIMKELSEVWNDLADIDTANILELIGGKRNATAVTSLLTNFKDAEAALQTASGASGSALKENEKYLDSINGKMAKFRAVFEDLSQSMIDSDLFKSIIDLATKFINVIDGIADVMGPLPIVLSAAGIAMSAFGKNLEVFTVVDNKVAAFGSTFGNILSDISKRMNLAKSAGVGPIDSFLAGFNASIKTVNENINQYNQVLKSSAPDQEAFMKNVQNTDTHLVDYINSLDGGQASLKGYMTFCRETGVQTEILGIKAAAASVTVKLLNTALQVAKSFVIGLAIQGVITGLDYIIHYQEKLAEKTQKSAQEYENLQNEIKNMEDQISENTERIKELNAAGPVSIVAKDEISRLITTNEELQRQLSIKRMLANIAQEETDASATKELKRAAADEVKYPGAVNAVNYTTPEKIAEAYRLYSNTVVAAEKDIAHLSTELEESILSGNKLSAWVKKRELKSAQEDLDKFNGSWDKNAKSVASAYQNMSDDNPLKQIAGEALDIYTQIKNESKSIKERLDEFFQSGENSDLASKLEEAASSGKDVGTVFNEIAPESAKQSLTSYGVSVEALSDYFKDLLGNSDKATVNLSDTSAVIGQIEQMSGGVNASLTSLSDQMEHATDSEENAIEAAKQYADVLGQVDNIQKLANSAIAVQESNINNSISAMETLSGVISNLGEGNALAGNELLDFMSNMQALPPLVDELGNTTFSAYDTLMEYLSATGDSTFNNGKIIQDVFQKYQEGAASSCQAEISLLEVSHNAAIAKLNDAMRFVKWWQSAFNGIASLISRLPKTKIGDDLQSALNYIGDSPVDKLQSKIDAQNAAYKSQLNKLKLNQVAINSLSDSFNTKYTDALNKSTDATKRAKEASEAQVKALEQQKKAADEYTKSLEDQQKALQKQISLLKDDQSSIESLLDTVEKYVKQKYEDQIDGLEKLIDAEEERHDKEIDNLEKERDKILDKLDAQKKLLEEKEDEYAHEKAIAEKQSTLENLQTRLLESQLDTSDAGKARTKKLQQELIDAQKEYDDYIHDYSLENQKSAIDTEREYWEDYYKRKENQITSETDKKKSELEKQLEQIRNYSSQEVNIRNEAIALIEARDASLYSNLIQWNRQYGDGIDANIRNIYNNGYAALDRYNQGHINVINTLNTLVTRTTDLQRQADALEAPIERARAKAQQFSDQISAARDRANELNNSLSNASSTAERLKNSWNGINSKSVSLDVNGKVNWADVYKEQCPYEEGTTSAFHWHEQHGYASGTLSVPKSDIYTVDELGEELILRQPESGRYEYLQKGDSVIPADITKHLMEFGIDPASMIRKQLDKQLGLAQTVQPQLVKNSPTQITIHQGAINCGFASNDMLKKIEKLQDEAADRAVSKINRTFRNKGIR